MNDTEQLNRRILIVDDDSDFLILLEKILSKKCNCDVVLASSGLNALEMIEAWHPGVVLTDIKMPDLDGLELLKRVTALDATITTIIMTGYGTIEMAVQALKDGAYDFYQKPFNNEEISGAVLRALERTALLRENRFLQKQLTQPAGKTGFVGDSKPLVNTIELLSRLATSCATVLIRGESGTGKEVAARAIHAMSKRADNKMVAVNCPALPEHILESELFGYTKGAFTGAETDKDGLFLEADGSTILLDEIGDISISVQTKLLRVLQEKEILPLGQTRPVKIDVRVLASTNQNLEEKMARGEFREDLFYRLNVMSVTMPTLSEIAEDIPLLAHHFLAGYVREYEREEMEFTPDALHYLMQKRWKGNVRELQNTVNRATLLCRGSSITPQDLAASSQLNKPILPDPVLTVPFLSEVYKEAKEKTLIQFSSAYLVHALEQNNGNVSAAARKSGMDRQAFQRLMRRYKISSDIFRS